jgi:hypothetical protein
MSCVYPKLYPKRAGQLFLIAFGAVCFLTVGSTMPRAQRQRTQGEDQPLFVDFKGVHLGMPAEEARKKLGSPRDKSDEQDFYVFNDNEAVQIFYDKSKTVSAISIDFMTGAADIPQPKNVIGEEPDTKPDGSSYKMVRYTKAGYWVSYSKTAGTSPTITITMQKIDR